MSTINEVAQRLNLTKSTVSHALNQRPGKMSEETRRRILETARQMGYAPNPAARAINNSRTGNIGLVSRQFNNALYTALLLEIAVAVDERGGNLVTCITGRTSEHHGQDHLLHSRLVDGLLAFPRALSGFDAPDSPWMKRPLVVLLPDTREAIASTVSFDEADGIAQVARHLREAGHHRVLFLQGLGPHDEQSYLGLERYACLQRVWNEMGGDAAADIARAEGQATVTGGYHGIQPALAGMPAFDAVVAYNDQMAVGVLSALHERGIRVPDDIAVIGWNDFDETVRHTIPSLSSVQTSPRTLARAALDLLDRQITQRRDDITPEREHIRVPVRLTLRASTRAADPSGVEAIRRPI